MSSLPTFLSTPWNLVGMIDENDPALDQELVLAKQGTAINKRLSEEMLSSGAFATIAGKWFPAALMIDINAGHLNLAEAVLDFAGDTPVGTFDILQQVGLTDENQELLAFSLDIALRDDARFDEVGPSGEVLWFLTAREPREINIQPVILTTSLSSEIANDQIDDQLTMFEGMIADEYESKASEEETPDKLTFSLIFPHWYSGTLPLSPALKTFFPTSIETPHVRFLFVDGKTKEEFPGWGGKTLQLCCGLKGLVPEIRVTPRKLDSSAQREKSW